jgi:hypothetical protein
MTPTGLKGLSFGFGAISGFSRISSSKFAANSSTSYLSNIEFTTHVYWIVAVVTISDELYDIK